MKDLSKQCKKILREAKSIVYEGKRLIKYKGAIYEKGNEYNGVIELYLKGKLMHIVKRKSNGTFFKWHL